MTSNIASQVIQGYSEAQRDSMLELVHAELKRHFRPEFLNRLDEVLVFHRLGPEHMQTIVKIMLGRLNLLLADRRISVVPDAAAVQFLAREGYDPDFGARPLRRTIQRLLSDPLAEMLLAGEIGDGDQVLVQVDGDRLKLVPPAKAHHPEGHPAPVIPQTSG
jgi:ATP-dependent Clp protease ATP-binding subunit ClpB